MKTPLFCTNKWYFGAGFLCFACHFFAFCAASYSFAVRFDAPSYLSLYNIWENFCKLFCIMAFLCKSAYKILCKSVLNEKREYRSTPRKLFQPDRSEDRISGYLGIMPLITLADVLVPFVFSAAEFAYVVIPRKVLHPVHNFAVVFQIIECWVEKNKIVACGELS